MSKYKVNDPRYTSFAVGNNQEKVKDGKVELPSEIGAPFVESGELTLISESKTIGPGNAKPVQVSAAELKRQEKEAERIAKEEAKNKPKAGITTETGLTADQPKAEEPNPDALSLDDIAKIAEGAGDSDSESES